MVGLQLAPWTVIRATAGTVLSVTQDAEQWLDVGVASDAVLWIEVADVATPPVGGGVISLHIESAPTEDESLFADACPPIVLAASPSPIVRKTVRIPSTQALSRILRWRVDVPGSSTGLWSATFRIRAVPLNSRTFVPSDIAGCQLWLRSDFGITLNGTSNVSAWADQSGNGRDATQSTAGNQPGYTASSINNLPSIDFDGVSDVLATATFPLGTYTVLLVTTGQNGTNGWFWTREPASHVVSDTLYGTTSSTMFSARAGGTSAWDLLPSWGQSLGATKANLLTVQMDGTHAGHLLRINGQNQSMSSTSAADPGTVSTTDMFTIGARSDSALPSKIKVAEVIVYDHSLAATDLARVEQYLRRRYALY